MSALQRKTKLDANRNAPRRPVRVRARIGPARAQTKTQQKTQKRKRAKKKAKAQAKAKPAVLTNVLFANAGSARRIGFAIDISGSMGAGTDLGMNRLDVVSLNHICSALAT